MISVSRPMSVLPASWPSQLPSWYGHSTASFSALAAPVIPPLDPFDSPFPSPTIHSHSDFSSALTAPSPPRRPTPHPRHHQSPNPTPPGSAASALGGLSNVPPRNTRSLDRAALIQVLNFLSTLLPTRFPMANGHQIRLVIHGGAVMLLNDELARLAAHTAVTDTDTRASKQRSATRDIDYIARSFKSEWAQRYGVTDADERLRECTLETALQFGLGADWMNSDADVALPMATDPVTGTIYDPIHAASLQSGDTLSVYTSPNGLLKLVSVTPFWAVALKLVRYNPADRSDICILLRSGTLARQLHWTPARLELWLLGTCWAMGYAGYDGERVREMRRRMVEVVREVNRWDPQAVGDDGWGQGGVVPLRQREASWPLQASFPGAMGGSFHSPLLSLGLSPETNSFPPTDTSSTVPFILGPPTPASKTKKTKTKKSKSKTLAPAAAATWSNRWTAPPWTGTDLPSQQQQQWDPNQPEQWAEGIRQAAEKDGNNTGKGKGNWFPWPWLRGTKSQPALRASAGLSGGRRWSAPQDSDFESEDSAGSEDEEESDTDDEEWLKRQRLKWGRTGRDAHGHGQGGGVPVVPAGIQHSVADFMSNGMTPLAAPAVLATGPNPASEQQQHVLPGWNLPGAPAGMHSPPSWAWSRGGGGSGGGSNAFKFGFGPGLRLQSPAPPPPPPWLSVYPRQHQFSPPVHHGMHAQSPLYPYPYAYPYAYPQTAATPGPDTGHVAVGGVNALGLYAG